jgi:hypothetical protein
VEQLQPLGGELPGDEGHAGQVSARSAQARDEPDVDRIGTGHENDRNRLRRGLGGERPIDGAGRNDDGYATLHQIGRQPRQPIILILREAILDTEVAALDKPGFLQASAERG